MSEKSKPGAGGLLIVERATTGSGEFIGLRLTLPESDKITLVFADQKAMPGFRYGKEFIPDFGETVRYADELSQLREELAQRDAEIEGLNAELDHVRSGRSELQSRVNALESQQAASVGGVPDVNDLANFIRHTDGNHKMATGALAERIVDWLKAPSAALSPAGGGVVVPPDITTSDAIRGVLLAIGLHGDVDYSAAKEIWNAALRQVRRVNAKPQANSQEAE